MHGGFSYRWEYAQNDRWKKFNISKENLWNGLLYEILSILCIKNGKFLLAFNDKYKSYGMMDVSIKS